MVGRALSLKYLAIASSKMIEQGSRGARLDISAWVCTSMATSSPTLRCGTYLVMARSALGLGQIREAATPARQLLQERRRSPPGALCLVVTHDIGVNLIEADGVGVEHRSAAIGGGAIARDVDDIDVARPGRDPLLEDFRPPLPPPLDAA